MTVSYRRLFLLVVAIALTSAALGAHQRSVAEIAAELQRLAAELLATSVTRVASGGDLQAALNRGGTIELEANGTYTGNFVARIPGTRLRGAGAALRGDRGHALTVPPGARDIQIGQIVATTTYSQAVIRLGANDGTQTRLEEEPSDIVLTDVRVPSHRGRRAIEVNARNVTITNAVVEDLWDPGLNDSQAICVLNSSGQVRITGGHLTAGSEIIMVGGDSMKLAGIQTTGITIEHVTLERPLAWRTDGVSRAVKNILELKGGIDVVVRDVRMRGSWTAAQTGEAIVITPRDRRVVDNVLLEDVDVADVGSGMQILGRDYTSYTAGAARVTVRRMRLVTNRATFGGQGRVATISGEPAALTFTDSVFLNDGDASLYVYRGTVMNADGTTRGSNPVGPLVFQNNRARRGQYGLFLDGFANGGTTGQGLAAATSMDVSGNTWGGDSSATVLQRNFPTNTYLSRAAFDLLVAAPARPQ